MECPIDETAIAQLEIKLSAPSLAGASRRGKHGALHPAGAISPPSAAKNSCVESGTSPPQGQLPAECGEKFPRRKRRSAPARAAPPPSAAQIPAPNAELTPRKGSSPPSAAQIPAPKAALRPREGSSPTERGANSRAECGAHAPQGQLPAERGANSRAECGASVGFLCSIAKCCANISPNIVHSVPCKT